MEMPTKERDPSVLVIGFHHARGPEIEICIGNEGDEYIHPDDWSLLPFMALTDGAHLSTEDFSYFTLRRRETPAEPATTLFGISCTRQLDSSLLLHRPPDVTRSTVQKAVVVIISEPRHCGLLRERLSVVTTAWFAQRDFGDTEILRRFHESLRESLRIGSSPSSNGSLGLSLREMVHEFKQNTLVLFKCLLLQPKMLFFGTRCERLAMIQFSLISLIPGLINNLQDCASPQFDSYAQTAKKPSTLKTSDRNSLLAYMGLPLQIFGKGSIFAPYTPLQQLDMLADYGTKSYVVGSTNSLLLQQKDRYSDILIDLDNGTINITSPSLRSALALTAADRRWINFLTQTINDTWDDTHPEQPRSHGYTGSEEFIRLHFEEYLLSLLSSMKYHLEITGKVKNLGPSAHAITDIEGDPALEFNADFLERWQTTPNFALFNRLTSDSVLFSIVEPRHPCAGGLSVDDIQRRFSELHLGERVSEGREALGKHIATGHKRVVSVFNNLWADLESKRAEQKQQRHEKGHHHSHSPPGHKSPNVRPLDVRPSLDERRRSPPPLSPPSASSSAKPPLSQRSTSYIGSWTSWAQEKRKEWQARRSVSPSVSIDTSSSPRPSSINLPLSYVNASTNTAAPSLNTAAAANTAVPMEESVQSSPTQSSPPVSDDNQPNNASKLTRGRSRRKRLSAMLKRSPSTKDTGERSEQDAATAAAAAKTKHEKRASSSTFTASSPIDSSFSSPLSRTADTAPLASSTLPCDSQTQTQPQLYLTTPHPRPRRSQDSWSTALQTQLDERQQAVAASAPADWGASKLSVAAKRNSMPPLGYGRVGLETLVEGGRGEEGGVGRYWSGSREV